MTPPELSGCPGIQDWEIPAMKRKLKLKLNRETLRNLEEREAQEAAGGNASTVFTQCGSCLVQCTQSCASCLVSCGGTCQYTCFVC
jgi:hypothetical protein